MGVLVLGPYLDQVDEPAPFVAPPPAPTRVGCHWLDPATSVGGIVHLSVDNSNFGVSSHWPTKVTAVYVPKGSEPAADARTPEWFLQSDYPKASASVNAGNCTGINITVPGVTPGLYFVQPVLEYNA